METAHAIAVVKTNSFTAPRISRTNLPATAREINGENRGKEDKEKSGKIGEENRVSMGKSTVSRHVNKNKHFESSLEYGNEDYVNDEDFYQNLVKLKEEHKNTLKLLETRYYNELKNQNNFQWEGFTQGVGLRQQNSSKQKIHDDFNNNLDTVRKSSQLENNEKVFHKPPKSPAVQDVVRDMSHSSLKTDIGIYDDDDDDESYEDEDVEEESQRSRSPEEFSSSLFPKRSAAIDMVEHLWKDFSVRDYTTIENEETIEEQDLTRKSTEKAEWSPTITVPKPFNMTLREARKEKRQTRSMKMVEEDLVLKKSMEEAELKKKFRAQPVPATTFLPLYEEIIDKNNRRSDHVRELNTAILKATEKPFNFIKREEMKKRQKAEEEKRNATNLKKTKGEVEKRASFKARLPPKNMDNLTLADMLTEQDEYRKIRTKLRAAELLAQSRLPPRMEAHASMTPAAKMRRKSREKREKKMAEKPPKFRPNINPDIPDFEALHWEFEKDLRRKKKERQPTVIEPFNLHTAQIPHEERSLRRIRSMENLSASKESPLTTRKARPYSARLSSSQDTLPFGTTESMRLRDSAVRKSLEIRKQHDHEASREKKQKQKREKQLRSQVTVKAMANDRSWQLRKQQNEKLKNFRETDRGRQEEYGRELAEMQQRIAERPLLLEQESRENAKRKAEQKYKRILRDAGVDETLVSKLVKKGEGIIDSDHEDDFQDESHDMAGRSGEYPPTTRQYSYLSDESAGSYESDSKSLNESV